ncbi:MAG: hypothetical protein GX447_00895 [Elusimicrobia bacterium]|nr:hypothetical protein [Elusimicrobiota bacterium]
MKNKILYAIISLFFIPSIILAFRGYDEKNTAEKIWLEVDWPAKKSNYYIEIDSEGRFMAKEEKNKKIFIREGQIKKMYAKDFFRETKNSEIVTRQNPDESKTLFYNGETLKISTYINGELRRAEAPMKNFSDSFKFAFSEMKKEIFKTPSQNKYSAFLTAIPLTGKLLGDFESKGSRVEDLKIIEIKKLKSQTKIFEAVNFPYRLIPLKNDEEISEISDFIHKESLPGMKSLFYIATTRGNFQCSVIEPR